MNLRDYKDWDKENGLLSVRMEPNSENRFVCLNGSTGNFCLDYTEEDCTKELAMQRAWSSDTGFYLRVLTNGDVVATNWWAGNSIEIPNSDINRNPKLFYQALTKSAPPLTGTIVSFAKRVFLRLRDCIQQTDNGQASLRTLMYLLAALSDGVNTPEEVNAQTWDLEAFDSGWINRHDWDDVYRAFLSGNNIKPLVTLVLRHASNRLFQEAHREATIKEFQTTLWGGTYRKYDSDISEGAFYTPTPLVRTIVQESLWALNKAIPLSERTSLKILDPACGSAEFLKEALRQLKIRNYQGTIEITGWDKSLIACEISRFVLTYENITEWDSRITLKISNKDSLIESWGQQNFDIVLMNPPFIPFDKLNDYKEVVLSELGGLTKRQPDAAALFWKRAAEIVAPKGILGLVLPFSFLGAETYSELRKYIKETLKFDFSLVSRLGSAGLFEKAMIIPSIQVGTKGESNANTVLWTNHQQKATYEAFRELRIYRRSDVSTPVDKESYSIYENEALTQISPTNNWMVGSYQSYKIAEKLKEYNTVGKLFDIAQGIKTGNNSIFIISKNEWLSKIGKKERTFFQPCITKDTLKNGQLHDFWYLFYPYGKFKLNSEEELAKKLPKYYKETLEPNKSILQKRKDNNGKWWELSRARLEWQLESTPKLVSTFFGKAGYFAFDKEGKFLLCQGFVWLPKKKLFKDEFYFAYLAVLHAPLINYLLEMVSVNVAGGQFNLSKRYLDNMPIPDLGNASFDSISYLIDIGKKINNGEPIDKNDLNQMVANLYGLNIDTLK